MTKSNPFNTLQELRVKNCLTCSKPLNETTPFMIFVIHMDCLNNKNDPFVKELLKYWKGEK